MNEIEKMKAGLWYDANDPQLVQERLLADDLCFAFNQILPSKIEARRALLKKLLGFLGDEVTILSPFYADYGSLLHIGHQVFINHDCYMMDGGTITIGSHCFIGPRCGLYTAQHPLETETRKQGLEKALPIVIEEDVWIGADVTILAGVRIGKGSVIGAKSLVTHSIPPFSLAYGNPCTIIRSLKEEKRPEAEIEEADAFK